jgi:hypothetical protein
MYLFQRNRLRFVLTHWALGELVDGFLAAEQSWLKQLGEGAEKLVAAVHHAYLYHLLRLGELATVRHRTLGTSPSEIDAIAELLIKLRAVVPLGPARLEIEPAMDRESATADQNESAALKKLAQNWFIREHEFRSDVPVLGPLIAAVRRQWNRVSTEWYVRSMFKQQSEFNALVVTLIGQLVQQVELSQYQRRRLGEVLTEYIGESGRELGEVAWQVDNLREWLERRDDA